MSAAADTIAALSTAAGPAPRIILRVSGPESYSYAARLTGVAGDVAGAHARTLHLGSISVPIWLYGFAAPRSYTGDDLIEFHIPGSPVLARMLLDALFALGARGAQPGEFTARAYAQGRMDLTQAEGVAATIGAANEAQLQAARRLLSGELARRLQPILDVLAQTVVLVEAGIDFAEEGISFLQPQQLAAALAQVHADLQELLDQSPRFERLMHEPRIVLVGRPNAGKSTLLNALHGSERAVVSDVPGTTRDALSAQVQLASGLVQLVDVAGLDEARDPMITQMRAHACRELETADLVLHVHDATSLLGPMDLPRRADLLILTKMDLCAVSPVLEGICVSALKGTNLAQLRERLNTLALGGRGAASVLALNARHVKAIAQAQAALQRAGAATADPELCAADLREALDALGEILGQVAPDDLLGRIFSSFCIGK